jgi:hypothetical protein
MKPWIGDATNYGELDEKGLVITDGIRSFLNIEKSYKYYVVAPKGVGKTLFLRFKKQLYVKGHQRVKEQETKEDIYFIPKDLELNRTSSKIVLDEERIMSLGESIDLWVNIWETSLELSIIKHLLTIYDPDYRINLKNTFSTFLRHVPPEVKELSEEFEINDPFGNLIEILKLNDKQIKSLHNHQNYLDATIKKIQSSVVIFIDNVDEVFDSYLDNTFTRDIWFNSQIGLVKAIRTIIQSNSHINIFSTIRKEAYEKLIESDRRALQFESETLDIKYTRTDLKTIFEKNIFQMRENDLKCPANWKNDPFYAFLGLKEIKLDHEEEDIFDYILRHTLRRPRDLMKIGEALQNISVKEREERRIRDVVNDTADRIATAYLNEMRPFTSINDFDHVFKLINSNILTYPDVKKICCKYNNMVYCEKDNCGSCTHHHIFCDLYRIGLLGIIAETRSEDSYGEVQSFSGLGETNWRSNRVPESNYYLIHPILNHTIKNKNKHIIIGDGRVWENPPKVNTQQD